MERNFEDTFQYRAIYVMAIHDKAHEGILKIGDASFSSEKQPEQLPDNCAELNDAAVLRIKGYTNTAAVEYQLLHTELAVRMRKGKDGNRQISDFRDHEVHKVLKNSGYYNKKIGKTTGREWFPVDLATAQKAITAVKMWKKSLDGSFVPEKYEPIQFRPEQQAAIDKTVKAFKKEKQMLWNAKMRFGKTLTALQVIRELKYKKTIIVTHRPVVDEGWHEDFQKIFYADPNYVYISKAAGNEEIMKEKLAEGRHIVYFASIQDLRGSAVVGGKFNKNDFVFSLEWDLVIVDEAHEGTTTALGDEVIKRLVKRDKGSKTRFLALSGTPFNILQKFENQVYTWDYVMEQERKRNWDQEHDGDSNPYADLPEMKIYTYDLGKVLQNSVYQDELEDKAFNFTEFFRTWTGDAERDHRGMPEGARVGDFVHKDDIWSFLNLITREDADSYYPFANESYRNLFRHTLWVVPGVREAKALSRLMKSHPVFGMQGAFRIVNVAGDGDEEDAPENALEKVRTAIQEAGDDGYTVTLTCGKLTTGVTVPEWTAVLMLAGSYSTSAASYLQTIFRVQSPCHKNGKVKSCCYVFDFAPDRTLKMVAEAVSLSTKAGTTTKDARARLGAFLNYCPVIAVEGTRMEEYNTAHMLGQIKKVYADRAVRTGFDDNSIYNDNLMNLTELDRKDFQELKKKIGSSKAAEKTKEITINDQGFDDEKFDKEIEKLSKERKKELTEEEKERLKSLRKKKEEKEKAIEILRRISIRIPLMIYGADVPFEEDITIEQLPDLVDDASWEEFMPNNISKDLFRKFIKYYDEDVVIAASRRIRNIAKSADALTPTERVQKIAGLFSCFRNPDKETVLTPWRVVNLHMSDCLGGYDFFDEAHEKMLDRPRFVDQGKVTTDIFRNTGARILEINSKTGLYPLYVSYSLFRSRCAAYSKAHQGKIPDEDIQQALWNTVLRNNIFVICKTPMARQITLRTLFGFHKEIDGNIIHIKDLLIEVKKASKSFLDQICENGHWEKRNKGKMKFDAIVGNPPYQVLDGGSKSSAVPVYNYFVEQAKVLQPKYISMIIPARWYSGGRGLDAFRKSMLSDHRIRKLFDYSDSSDCFNGVDIAGGICYFLWDQLYDGQCEVTTIYNGKKISKLRNLNEHTFFVRYWQALSIIRKVKNISKEFLENRVSSQKPFGLRTYVVPLSDGDITLRYSKGTGPYKRELVSSLTECIDKWKVIMSYLTYDHAGKADRNGKRRIFSTLEILPPGAVCTETYIVIDSFDNKEEAENLLGYLKTLFVRFLVAQVTTTQHISKSNFSLVPVQDFSRSWTDEDLYKKYGLNQEEINFIESMIKPM